MDEELEQLILKYHKLAHELNNLQPTNYNESKDIQSMNEKIKSTFDDLRDILNNKERQFLNQLKKIQQKHSDQNINNDTDSYLYVIGKNQNGELALNHTKKISKLTKHNTKIANKIKSIHCGKAFNIYVSIYDTLWASGDNTFGQCTLKKSDSGSQTERIINQFARITYFEQNNINIEKICTSITTTAVFWITDTGNVYITGYNGKTEDVKDGFKCCNRRLTNGLGQTRYAKPTFVGTYEPKLIHPLKNVIDVQANSTNTIALCTSSISDMYLVNIIKNWCRINNDVDSLPKDITNLILIFCKYNEVYSCCGLVEHEWKKIDVLCSNDRNIIQIRTGHQHCLFLDADGTVYVSGIANDYVLGLGHSVKIATVPTVISFFVNNNIQIRQIECGEYFNLAMDNKNKIYSWGSNKKYQCGDGTKNNVATPKLIEALRDCNVLSIQCGATHSYAYCDDGEHYVWGSNLYHECIVSEYNWITQYDRKRFHFIKKPYCINSKIAKKLNQKQIKVICLGVEYTLIVSC